MEAFSIEKNDRLTIGRTYYFDNPGDVTTSAQGWSVIYYGQLSEDTYGFWSHPGGLQEVKFRPNSYVVEGGRFDGNYLSSLVRYPHFYGDYK